MSRAGPKIKLLILARSARALAVSANRAGFEAVAVDGFGDLDLRRGVSDWRTVAWRSREILKAALELSREERPHFWLYGGGLEPFPMLVSALERRIPLLGNPPPVLRKIEPRRLSSILRQCGVPQPEISTRGRYPKWLYKMASSGGMGVFRSAYRKGGYWQRRLFGRVYTFTFLADRRRLLWSALHLLEVLPWRRYPALFQAIYGPIRCPFAPKCQARWMAQRLIRRLRLGGWNSLDLILHRGRFFLIDLNPRPGAAINLWDPLFPQGAVAAHVAALRGEKVVPKPPSSKIGYGVVWARQRRSPPARFPEGAVDLPAQATFRAGQPICGLLLRGESVPSLRKQFRQGRQQILRSSGGKDTRSCGVSLK